MLTRRTVLGSMWVLAAAVGGLGCATGDGIDGGNGTYDLRAIQLEGMGPQKDGSLKVQYRPPAETMYACPGIDVAEQPPGTLRVTFVRTPKSAAGGAQIPATLDPATGVAIVFLPDAVNKQVILVGGEWEREIWRRGGPIR
jgi:hypothetical protein